MSIADWPESERPREKLLNLGPQYLSDAELLAIFLRVGCTGKSAVDLARELLQKFGGLRPLMEASQAQFCEGLGLGNAKYAQLQAVLEMARRHLSAALKEGELLTSPTQVKQFLTAHLRHQAHEVFAVLYLDNQHRLIAYDELFHGTIDGAQVYPRTVVKQALARNAAAAILAHNHPSGEATPSHSDRALTQRLKEAFELIDVRLLDHMVVGNKQVFSFAEGGLL